MMDAVTWALVFAFAVTAVAMLLSKIERIAGVFFIIRSSWGIKLIDRVARFKPRMWEFLADFSVLLSFGGFGAYYLSANDETRRNYYVSLLLFGIMFSATCALIGQMDLAAILLALTFIMYYALKRIGNPAADFIFTCILIFLGLGSFFDTTASAIASVFGLPALMIYVMATHGFNIIEAKTNLPGVSPMLPGEQGGNVGVKFPGYDLFIPWWYALVALLVTLTAHEGAHGILTRVAGVKLKSTGILTLLSMPVGAFVEPDEEELNRKSSAARMRVYTMGSFANIVVGAVAFALILAFTSAMSERVYSDGMKIVGFMDGYPAKGMIPDGSVVYSVNGKPSMDFIEYRNVTADLKPGMDATLNTSTGAYTIHLASNPDMPERGFVGVYLAENLRFRGVAGSIVSFDVISFMIQTLGWIAFFNVNIALVNLLPVLPFDGGRMFKEFVSTLKMSQLNVNRILYAVVGLTAMLFIVNMIPLFKMLLNFIINL